MRFLIPVSVKVTGIAKWKTDWNYNGVITKCAEQMGNFYSSPLTYSNPFCTLLDALNELTPFYLHRVCSTTMKKKVA